MWVDNVMSALASVTIGVFFIVRSRWVVEKIFKGEEE